MNNQNTSAASAPTRTKAALSNIGEVNLGVSKTLLAGCVLVNAICAVAAAGLLAVMLLEGGR